MLPVPAEDWDCGRRIAVSAHVATPGAVGHRRGFRP